MNFLAILQLISALSPEVLALIQAIAQAVQAAPAQHQQAITTAAANVPALKGLTS